MEQPERIRRRTSYWFWLGPLIYMVVVALYFIGRYAGKWAETDSATFTNLIRVFSNQSHLVPIDGEVYPNGFAYQSISTFILALTGLDVTTLQQLVYPLIAAMVVLPAWVLYRELTGSARGATLTTILLFTQPDFLFVILRSSHEKFSRALLLVCLYLLIRSFKLRDQPRLFVIHIGLLYLAAFALIASNNLLAHSFILALFVALVFGWLLEIRPIRAHSTQPHSDIVRRLAYTTLICLGLAYLFTFYIYLPAQHDLLILKSTWEGILALLTGTTTQVSNAYTEIQRAWIEPSSITYFTLTIANWVIFLTALILWVRQGLRWFVHREPPPTRVSRFLWLFYSALGVQGALAVLSDATGAIGGNLQYRLFPSFSIISVALVGIALARWRPRRFAKQIWVGMAIGIFCFAILSALKATNEPVFSNKWTFYHSGEMVALTWSDAHLKDAAIWTEYDERLAVAFNTERGQTINQNRFRFGSVDSVTRNLLVTNVTRLRRTRWQLALPVPPDALRVYDNGEAQLYHLRPQTPYQR